MYYTYILISKSGKRTYTGSTSNLQRRIIEHNRVRVKSSKHFRPYDLLQVEEFNTQKEAKEKELFYKSTIGRRKLRQIIEKWR